jgi:glucosamine--fructose-6-phosphate aminotransferase (isomerizing)
MMETAELLHFGLPLCDEHTLVVAVSQSGGSAETVRLLERKTPARVLGVTNTADSALARSADLVLLAQAGPEHSVSCKTYVSGMLILQWLAGVLCGRGESRVLQQLAEAPQLVAQCLQGWQQGVPLLADRLRGVRHLFLAGRGPSLAAVGTGALIIKEATRVHAEGMSSAAFRHGPIEMLGPDVLLVMIDGDARTALLNAPLVRDLAALGGQCERLGSDATLVPLRLPDCDPLLLPLLEVVPVQLMTLALASLTGHEAGHFERAAKITDRE